MKQVLIGLLGVKLDRGDKATRWEHWRPTVSLFSHEDLLFDRFDMLYEKKWQRLANTVEKDIQSISPETKVHQHQVMFRDAWDFEDVFGTLHDFAKSYPFNLDQEQYYLHITTGTHVAQICEFLLAESNFFPAKLIQSSPPPINEPENPAQYNIIDLDLSKYDRIATRFHQESQDDISFLKSGIETKNKKFNHLIEQIEKVAIHSMEPMLLMGPTGAGKSQLAKRIFELKNQRSQCNGSFVEINCATLRGDHAMSSLFGHKAGAFTGATKDRTGQLLKANGGILFLDEIGELGLDEQAMILRAIEEKQFLPLGADKEVQSNFQLICGTNRDLNQQIIKGNFREDLLARINLWSFQLPSLNERREDIEPNLLYELERFTQSYGKKVVFNKEARQKYLQFAKSPKATWDANFRDLNGSIKRMATLAISGRITTQDVSNEIKRLNYTWQRKTSSGNIDILLNYFDTNTINKMDYFDQVQLAATIKVCQKSNNLSQAGRELFAASRLKKSQSNDSDRLKKYLHKFDLSWDKIRY